VKAKQFVVVATESVEMLKAHVSDIQKLQKAGMAQVSDILKVQVQLSEAEYRLLEAKNQMQLAMMGLNNTLRLPLDTQLNVTEIPNEQVPDASLESMVDKAIMIRPDLKASELRVKAGETQVKVAKSSWYPQISAFAEYNYNNPNMRIVPARSQFDQTWAAGIQISMDVWNWGLNSAHVTSSRSTTCSSIGCKCIDERSHSN